MSFYTQGRLVVAIWGAFLQWVLLPDVIQPCPLLPFGLCVVGNARRSTISTELWINSALEETNLSRKSYSTKINEQQR